MQSMLETLIVMLFVHCERHQATNYCVLFLALGILLCCMTQGSHSGKFMVSDVDYNHEPGQRVHENVWGCLTHLPATFSVQLSHIYI